ncbi:MAG: mechanosensitive ion channel domain-containing protein [Pseudomonadota bacterium]
MSGSRLFKAPALLLIFIALLFSSLAQFASAQVPGTGGEETEVTREIELPDPLTPETVRELVSRLSDAEVRELLLKRLDAVAEGKLNENAAAQEGIIDLLGGWAIGVSTAVYDAVVRVPLIGQGLSTGFGNFYNDRGFSGVLRFFAILAGAIVAGLATEFLISRFTTGWRNRIQQADEAHSLGEMLTKLGMRLLLDLIGLIAFFIVIRAVTINLMPASDRELAILFLFYLVVIPRIGVAFSRMLVAPIRPDLRLMYATDTGAKFFHRNQVGMAMLVGFTIFIIQFQVLNGVPMGETRLGFWLNLAIFAWFGVVSIYGREYMSALLTGAAPEEITSAEAKFARIYPWLCVVVVLVIWLFAEILVSTGQVELLQGGKHIVTLILITYAPVFDTMIRGLVRHLVPPMSGEGVVAERAYYSTKRSYIRIGRLVVFSMVVLVIARMWDVDFENLASASLGARFAGRFIEVLFILAIGYLVWEVVTLLINRKLAAEQTAEGFDLEQDEPGGGEGGGTGVSRLSTVLPMIRFTAQVAIVLMTVLIALGNLGIDITPLLAGAGIVGIAIGFGAQTLVRDVVSGVFFLVDDAFRVGEYIEISDTVGTVEKISLRSLQLRHHNGPIHTIPYGEIPKVTNNSRDWVIMKLKFTVPFGTDVGKIKKLFKQIGADMLEADYAEDLIQTFKSQGVYDVDDVGMVIRGKFMAKPGTQWIIRKDVYQRVQRKLEENGIEFARREVRVQIPGIDSAADLNDDQRAAIGAAAGQAVGDQAPAAPKPDTP